jgi:outer membrane protein assembly factor BamB
MKHRIFQICALLICFASCEKGEPVVADPTELAIKTLNEIFYSQPVVFDSTLVSIIRGSNATTLCSYYANGEKRWQKDLSGFLLLNTTYDMVQKLSIRKDFQENLVLTMVHSEINPTYQSLSQNVKVVLFNQNGEVLSQFVDHVHQANTIIIQADTLNMSGSDIFMYSSLISFSNGNCAIVSSKPEQNSDNTLVQLTIYNNSSFIGDKYFRLAGQRKFISAYGTSDNQILIANNLIDKGPSIIKIDTNGNIAFEIRLPIPLQETYFFKENSEGNYILTGALRSNDGTVNGGVFCVDPQGKILWSKVFDNPGGIILSINEAEDGYMFYGFTPQAGLPDRFDWRTTFKSNQHHALMIRTDRTGNEKWRFDLEGSFNSSGAASLGTEPIVFFGGIYEPYGQNIFLLKLTDNGKIQH